MKTAIAVFAKTPGISPIKTRLAADIGKEKAEEFYLLSVKAVEDVIMQAKYQINNSLAPYWAIAEENGHFHPGWSAFPVIWTGEGEFGKRLFNISSCLLEQYSHVIMIGTDSPQLEPEMIIEVIQRLEEKPGRCLIGPCTDGGFYLFASAYKIPEKIWTNVEYSREDTLQQLVEKLNEAGIRFDFLPELGDVDRYSDLEDILKVLALNKNCNLPSQRKLYEWLTNYVDSNCQGH